jgi:hypothetical protein
MIADSCVELFLSSSQVPNTYFNFELSCIGTVLAHSGAFGVPAGNRTPLSGMAHMYPSDAKAKT